MNKRGVNYHAVFIVNNETSTFTSFMNLKRTEFELPDKWEVFTAGAEPGSTLNLLTSLGYAEVNLGIALNDGLDMMNTRKSAAELLAPRQPVLTVELAEKIKQTVKTLPLETRPVHLTPAYPSGQLGMEASNAPQTWLDMYSALTGVQKAAVTGAITQLARMSSNRVGDNPPLEALRGIKMGEMIYSNLGSTRGLGERRAAFLELVFDY